MNTMQSIQPRGRQQGFTIIELVVVILLLGILTATALPRFLDVTTEAHDSVVDATRSGLQTGGALFRAQWIAEDRPTTAIAEFGGMFANTAGYPVGLGTTNAAGGTDDNTLDDHEKCQDVFVNLLQAGAPSIANAEDADSGSSGDTSDVTAAALTQNDIDAGVADGADFITKWTSTGPNICTYAYIADAQRQTIGSSNVPAITYNATTGEFSETLL